jgi:hypothetical protein
VRIDLKTGIIIVLVGVIGLLLGLVVGKSSAPSQGPAVAAAPVANYGGDADGKLAKEFKEKVLLKVIRDNAKDLQICYFALLEKKPKVSEGVLDYIIQVEEDGKISNVKLIKNEFADGDMAECVTKKLMSYYLSPPPYGINRFIAHTIAFKSEATANKEAKERALKSQPPKVMPVNP